MGPAAAPAADRDRRRALIALVALVLIGVALRLIALYDVRVLERFAWSDPDQYLSQAHALTRGGSWHWTFDAVRYSWGRRLWVLPPGYPVFLSLFALWPSTFPGAAAIAQVVVGAFAAVPMYFLGEYLQSRRAGLIPDGDGSEPGIGPFPAGQGRASLR